MIEYKNELKKIFLLVEPEDLENNISTLTKLINEKDLAYFFIESIYLKNVIRFVIEDHWIKSQNSHSEIQFERFIKKFLTAELQPLLFLHSFFLDSSIEGLQIAEKALDQTVKILLACIKSKTASFKKEFLKISLKRMSELYELEHQLNLKAQNDEDANLSLYRAFDILDEIFGLDYLLDEVASIEQKERLYEGGGVGVQSSYATTVLALRYLNLNKDSRFIDLGSGYGRIGLILGLMRPDIQFTGYEFVKERVDIANKAKSALNLDQHVHFVTQDLSDVNFKIPVADTYYIFDSFTDSTYAFIMGQLEAMVPSKKITVVTKGNAKLWMKSKYWSEPQEFNGGNLCFFRSRGNPRSQ